MKLDAHSVEAGLVGLRKRKLITEEYLSELLASLKRLSAKGQGDRHVCNLNQLVAAFGKNPPSCHYVCGLFWEEFGIIIKEAIMQHAANSKNQEG